MTNCGKYGILDAALESGPRTEKKNPQQFNNTLATHVIEIASAQ